MRCVAAPTGAGPTRPSETERAALESVRHLNTRYPAAQLREVPLVRAVDLDGLADPSGRTRVWLALEMLQVTGSFKVRGALVSLESHKALGKVVATGGGNHALAVAYAASVHDVVATVCVPRHLAPRRRARLERYGARLVEAPSSQAATLEAFARELAASDGAAFVSPEDGEVVRGNGASLGFEIVSALGGVPERVLVPFGTGGLATGLAAALAVESRDPDLGADPHVWGALSGRHPAACGAEAPCAPTAPGCQAVAGLVVPSEENVQAAASHAFRDMGLIIEARAAAALAPVLFGLPEPVRGGDLVVVLTGRNTHAPRPEPVLQSTRDGGV